MLTRRLVVGIALVGVLAAPVSLVSAAPALAYQGCNTSTSGGATPTTVDANQPIDFTVTFRDCNGAAEANVKVTFAQGSGPAGCFASFSPTSATTGGNGVAHTTVTLPPNCPCQYVISATGNGVTVNSTVRENGCLPFTAGGQLVSTPASHPAPLPAVVLAAGAALMAVSAAVLLRWRRA